MTSTEQLLETGTLSSVIDNTQPVRTFLTRLLRQDEEILHTETAELSTFEGDAETAPFVRKNGRSIQVDGDSETFATVETPNIRISRVIEPAKLLDERRPGDGIFISRDGQISSAERYIARTARRLRERLDNTQEYLWSQLLQGQISYQVSEQANFQITVPRLASHDIDLATAKEWDNATQTDVHIYEDFDLAKSLVSEAEGMAVTDALMGTNAAIHFLRNAEVRELLNKDSGITTGEMDLRRKYRDDGAIFLGEFCGLNCWKYPRTISVDGTPTALIRANHVEFVSALPATQATTYYGTILDMEAYTSRQHNVRVYAKSWLRKDPSVLKMLVHSRPLPWFPRPNANVSMDVLA